VRIVEKKVEFRVVYETQDQSNDDAIASLTLDRSDGHTLQLVEGFSTPLRDHIAIRLLRQTPQFQQFEIVNPFPARFSFNFGGRDHRIAPQSAYCLLRPVSGEPLSLSLTEEGWDGFPVRVSTEPIDANPPVIALNFDAQEWTAGTPRLVVADPPAFPLTGAASDWIVGTRDIIGREHIFVPKRPGLLLFPPFEWHQHTCSVCPAAAKVVAMNFPPFLIL
jgi:hypothetical protein